MIFDKLLIAIAVKSNYHKRYETQNSGFIKLRQRSQICLTFNLLMVRYLIFHFYELTSYGHIDYKSFQLSVYNNMIYLSKNYSKEVITTLNVGQNR